MHGSQTAEVAVYQGVNQCFAESASIIVGNRHPEEADLYLFFLDSCFEKKLYFLKGFQ